jgi:hypothetical protein
LKRLFADQYGYVSLEPPDIRLSANEDPRAFIEMYPPPAIFDEVQYAPDLLPYVKEKIDQERSNKGQYLLSGSQNLLLMERVSESLAGRAAILKLLPLSRREAEGRAQAPLFWETKGSFSESKKLSYLELWQCFIRGGYPELVVDPERDITLWHASYVQTYLERDVRSLRQVGDLTQFQTFLRALAAGSAQPLNVAELAHDIGVSGNTALFRKYRQAPRENPESLLCRCRHPVLFDRVENPRTRSLRSHGRSDFGNRDSPGDRQIASSSRCRAEALVLANFQRHGSGHPGVTALPFAEL